jgi:hypothetical protein
MELTDIKRPQAIAVFYKYLVYQVSSRRSVSESTVCCKTRLSSALGASDARLLTNVLERNLCELRPLGILRRWTASC